MNCSVRVIANYVDSPAPQVLMDDYDSKCFTYYESYIELSAVFFTRIHDSVGIQTGCVCQTQLCFGISDSESGVSHLTHISTFHFNPDSWFLIKLLIRYVLPLENMLVIGCLLIPVFTGKQSQDCLLCINSVIFSGTVKLVTCFWMYENRS